MTTQAYDTYSPMAGRRRHQPPSTPTAVTRNALLAASGRKGLEGHQFGLLRPTNGSGGTDDLRVFYAGSIDLPKRTCVSMVGAGEVSNAGWQRAGRLAREPIEGGVVIVSGLAKGVDTAAMTGAIDCGGKTIGVIGTPLNQAYPAENGPLFKRRFGGIISCLSPSQTAKPHSGAIFPSAIASWLRSPTRRSLLRRQTRPAPCIKQ